MDSLDSLDLAFVAFAFLFQAVLIVHFAARRVAFATALRYGPLVYALAIPALVLSGLMLAAGKPWAFWLGGLLFAVWAAFGYTVEYVRRIEWRSPPRWPVFGPYVLLYLATVMFYWWPLALLSRPLWAVYAVLFVVATALNIASHRGPRPAAG